MSVPVARKSHLLTHLILGASVGAGSVSVPSTVLRSQDEIPLTHLGNPALAFPDGFTSVRSVRELSDGRVIVLDVGLRTVQMIDSTWSTVSQIGRHGAGPGEYYDVNLLFALPGDSSAVWDRNANRLLVITPDGQPGDFMSAHGAAGQGTDRCPNCPQSLNGIRLLQARANDSLGYWYALAMPIIANSKGELELTNSRAIERWTLTSRRRDTVALVPYDLPEGSRIFSGFFAYSPRTIQAFQSNNQWAVSNDGRVAVVHPEPYRVDFFNPDGTRVSGKPILYEPVPVSEAHKEAWRAWATQTRPVMTVTRDGQVGNSMRASPAMEPEWPRTMPPFLAFGANREPVLFAPDGMLWVQRATAANAPSYYDLFDRMGRIANRIELAHDGRVVGFGIHTVYVVRRDEFDLEYLERHALPAAGGR